MPTPDILMPIPVLLRIQKVSFTPQMDKAGILIEVSSKCPQNLVVCDTITGEIYDNSGALQSFRAPIAEITIPARQTRAVEFILPLADKEIGALLNMTAGQHRIGGAVRRVPNSVLVFPWRVDPN